MKQEVEIIARTFEVSEVAKMSGKSKDEIVKSTSDDLTIISGKAAGVCYMPDDYFDKGVQDVKKALDRANMTKNNGHHSVYDHGHITFVIKTNKMMAMILNSLGVYATSEKSARYTKMQPETELELQLYDKWKEVIKELILKKYPDMDDDALNKAWLKKYPDGAGYKVINGVLAELEPVLAAREDKEASRWFREKKESMLETLPSSKLAQENARYMISVFTPTTLEYTVSFRQAFLTMNYLYDLYVNLEHAEDSFSNKLKPHVLELWKVLVEALDDIGLTDNKNQYIRFLEAQHVGELIKTDEKPGRTFIPYTDLDKRLEPKKTNIADNYTVVYNESLAMLAQAQRHRTLRYTMKLQEAGENGFYTPEIVKDAGLEEEWQEDIQSVAYCIPQGTIVRITEQGLFEDFALKCKERLCGRAQLEIMKSTAELMMKFIKNHSNLSYSNIRLLETITDLDAVCARCKFKGFKCTEGCQWGPNKALTRLI